MIDFVTRLDGFLSLATRSEQRDVVAEVAREVLCGFTNKTRK